MKSLLLLIFLVYQGLCGSTPVVGTPENPAPLPPGHPPPPANTVTIATSTIGGLAAFALGCFLFWWCCCRGYNRCGRWACCHCHDHHPHERVAVYVG